MPTVDDYDEQDNGQTPGPGGGPRITGGGGTQLKQATPQQESSFVPWSRFVSANQDVAQHQADKLNSQVQGEVGGATTARNNAADSFSQQIESNYNHMGDASQQPARAVTSQPSAFGGAKQAPGGFTMSSPAAAPKPTFQQAAAAPQQQSQYMAAPTAAPSFEVKGPVRTGLKTDAAANGPQGSKSLEDMMGAGAWGKLLGDTQHAQQDANALNSETGVQSLIQKQAQQPLAQGGAFDAALEYGQGQKAFGDTAKAGAGLGDALTGQNANSQEAWHSLVGDIDAARSQSQADATNTANAQAPAPGAADLQTQAQSQLDYLKQKFPIPPQFDSQDAFIDFVAKNRTSNVGTNNSALRSWADQIYGPDASGNQWANMDRLYSDIRKMTPAEYEAFKYGVVPAWMGLGSKASGANGGSFWGLGNTGSRTTAETTDRPTDENANDWNEKQSALKAYYNILAAIASAG